MYFIRSEDVYEDALLRLLPRDERVIRYRDSGKSVKDIALLMCISPSMVCFRRDRARRQIAETMKTFDTRVFLESCRG